MAAPRAIASTNGSTAERSAPNGARSDSRDATPPKSVGEDRADFRASDDAEELTRSSIFTDRCKNACSRACRALSGVWRAVLTWRLSPVVYHVHRVTYQTRATASAFSARRWTSSAPYSLGF